VPEPFGTNRPAAAGPLALRATGAAGIVFEDDGEFTFGEVDLKVSSAA
jgi:hypothetical protein